VLRIAPAETVQMYGLFNRSLVIVHLIALVITSSGCHTASSTPPSDHLAAIARPQIEVPLAAIKPRLDASVDDPAWESAATIAQLGYGGRRTEHPESIPPRTQVRLLWDAEFLYVRFDSDNPEPRSPHGVTRNAKHHEGDVVEVFLDPRGDGRQYFEVQVNPAGGVLDVIHFVSTDAPPTRNLTLPRDQWREHWSYLDWIMPGLITASRIHSQADQPGRWVVDIAIPAEVVLARDGVKRFTPMKLRANFLRLEQHGDATTAAPTRFIGLNWAPTLLGLPHRSPAAMGYLKLYTCPNLAGCCE